MPAGLQVFNQFGALEVDIGDRVGRWLFTLIIPPSSSGSLNHPGLLQGTPIPFTVMYSDDSAMTFPGDSLFAPIINFSGDLMTWTGGPATHRVEVWVY